MGLGLDQLRDVALPAELEKMLESARKASGGSKMWRERKTAEGRDLFRLATLAPQGRLDIEMLDLNAGLRAILRMRTPVPCRVDEETGLSIAKEAVLGLTYPEEAIQKPMAGYVFVQILAPKKVFHANVAPDFGQPLCLGRTIPPGVRVTELVLMAYGALSMQSVMIDEADAAGVLNEPAALWWQQNTDRIPLSSVPFLGTEDLEPGHTAEKGAISS